MLCNLCAKKCNKKRDDVFGEGNCHMPLKIKIAQQVNVRHFHTCKLIQKNAKNAECA